MGERDFLAHVAASSPGSSEVTCASQAGDGAANEGFSLHVTDEQLLVGVSRALAVRPQPLEVS